MDDALFFFSHLNIHHKSTRIRIAVADTEHEIPILFRNIHHTVFTVHRRIGGNNRAVDRVARVTPSDHIVAR